MPVSWRCQEEGSSGSWGMSLLTPLLTDFLRLSYPTGCPRRHSSKNSRAQTCLRHTCCPLQPVCAALSMCNAVSPRECLILEILFQLSARPISNESAKETKKPLAGGKDPSEDQGSHPSEAGAASISSTQLVCVVSDLGRLQEWVSSVALVDTWICELWGPTHRPRTQEPLSGAHLCFLVPAVMCCTHCFLLSGES